MRTRILLPALAMFLIALAGCKSEETAENNAPAPAPPSAPAVTSVPALANTIAAGTSGATSSAPGSTAAPAAGTTGNATKSSEPSKPGKPPIVELDTSMGKIKIQLDPEKAPISTRNFLEYVKSGHYNGTIFHRVIPGFMIQGGGFTPDMAEKKTREPIRNEAGNGLSNTRGTIAMARTRDPDSATAQFYINVVDNSTKLDRQFAADGAGYTVFGKVISGMDVADKIVNVKTTTKNTPQGPMENVPEEAVVIKSAKVVSK